MKRRSGFVLIVVLVVIAALTLAALGYSEWVLVERQAADLAGRQAQARLLAESGVELARAILGADPEMADELGGWYDNPGCFQAVPVLDDERAPRRGRFTLLVPGDEEGSVRFGLENESAKLNLNALVAIDEATNGGREMLLALPGMTEEIADAILDWLDPDDEPRDYGAEAEYYTSCDPPCIPKNGPLQTLEELLLVRGVTPQLLFGIDANRNGAVDPGEAEWSAVLTDSLDRGWSAYLTLYSRESNLTPEGTPKIDVNQSDMEALHQALSEVLEPQWATFIVAYRQQSEPYEEGEEGKDEDGGEDEDEDEEGREGEGGERDEGEEENRPLKVESQPSGEPDFSLPGRLRLESVLDLIGQRVRVKYQGQTEEVILESPFPEDPEAMRDYLPKLMDYLATDSSPAVSGRINIFQAPEVILAGIPGMTPEIASEIVSRRASAVDSTEPHCRHATWLLIEGIVTLDQMKSLLPWVTTGGDVYRAQVVGYFEADGPHARIEAVLDATTRPAAVLFWRDLSRLGHGYPAETLGESGQAGTGTAIP